MQNAKIADFREIDELVTKRKSNQKNQKNCDLFGHDLCNYYHVRVPSV